MSQPRNYSELPGWRDAYLLGRRRQREARVNALVSGLPRTCCGERVRQPTLHDLVILDAAASPFVSSPRPATFSDAIAVLWVLSPRHRAGGGWRAWMGRRWLACRVTWRYAGNPMDVVKDVENYLTEFLLDLPGRFAGDVHPIRESPEEPRRHWSIALIAEVAAQFPGIPVADLWSMPMSQFWQWLHSARMLTRRSYLNDQLTDAITRQGLRDWRKYRAGEYEKQRIAAAAENTETGTS